VGGQGLCLDVDELTIDELMGGNSSSIACTVY
jgi:hypothetical protein